MENKIVVGNLRNEMTASNVSEYLNKINKKIDSKNVIICPSNIYVPYFIKQKYKVGLQNIYINDTCTGEITPLQAKSLGLDFVIIGHSDRKETFNESYTLLNKKIVDCLNNDLSVIVCIGETITEKQMLKTARVLKNELVLLLKNIKEFDNIYIAYEPIWAIRTKVTPNNKEIKDTVNYIKDIVFQEFNYKDIKVIYGGSVDEKNIKNINKIKELSGVIIGTVSNDAQKFIEIVEEVVK